MSLDVAGREILVVGLAESGAAAARVLAAHGARVRVTEARPLEEVAERAGSAEAAGVRVLAGGHALEHLEGVDVVVTSPGVPQRAEVLRWALERRLPVWSELEVGARLTDRPYIAVTGTNGKTTTTEMVAAAMREAGLDAVACGNVGFPFSLAAGEGHQALVVEASSFQLRFHESFHPKVSVLLNLAPDHLDWHGSFDAYRDAKRRIFERQDPGDVHVGNHDDREAAAVSRRAPCPVTWFTLGEPAEGEAGYTAGELVVRMGGERSLGRLAPRGPGHLADAAAAAAASLAFGLDPEAVGAALRGFDPLPHRGSVVAEVGGVRFVDDSKATNPHAALASMGGWPGAVLIAGGLSKGVDLSPLTRGASRLGGLVAMGDAAGELVALFDGLVPVKRAATLEEAVEAAYRMAGPDGVVLLAPACASQDMFRDYRERGERFAEVARRLVAPAGAEGGSRG